MPKTEGFRKLADMTKDELDALFREATIEAAGRALDAGLPIVGLIDDKLSRLHPDGTIEPLK